MAGLFGLGFACLDFGMFDGYLPQSADETDVSSFTGHRSRNLFKLRSRGNHTVQSCPYNGAIKGRNCRTSLLQVGMVLCFARY